MGAKLIYKKVGKMIREIRREKNITQEYLALNANLNRAYIGYIERGERHPSLATLYKISVSLKTPLYKLFIFTKGE